MLFRSIREHLPDECKEAVEILQERWDDASVEDILEEIMEEDEIDELESQSIDEAVEDDEMEVD